MRHNGAMAALAILLLMGTPAGSQANSTPPRRAAVSVTALRNLDFQDVLPGVNQSIGIAEATSGKWRIQGDASTSVAFSFPGLPATLTDGVNTIPIVYSATDAAYHTSDDPASATTFDPSVGASALLSAAGELYVWIGGTVQPSEVAIAGSYNATITLDSDYD